MSIDIESYIKACRISESFARKQERESLCLYPVPQRPWERVAIDIFSYAIKDRSISAVIEPLKKVFSTFEILDFVTCDNIPFDSATFKDFAKCWNFRVVTRSPNYSRSNGLAEKGVGRAKNIIKKALKGKEDVEVALMQYRSSPLKHMGYSPSQLLMSRICKTKVRINPDLLFSKMCENVGDKLVNKQSVYSKYYNRQAKELKSLEPKTDITCSAAMGTWTNC